MTLTASDVDSLARSLSHWEIGEYVSEVVVIIGCAGELIADVCKALPRRARRHIERFSTVVLILGLIASLKCLTKTNQLSGNEIGSLGKEAATADANAIQASGDASRAVTDSKTALSQAEDALNKTAAAEETMNRASDEALRARSSASNALSLATSARQEADSFEKDIGAARKLAADAEQHLADALREATRAQTELNRIRSPRSLINEPALIAALAPFKGAEYTMNVFQDDESVQFTKMVDAILGKAGWVRQQPTVHVMGIPYLRVFSQNFKDEVPVCIETGIQVHVQAKETIEVLRSTPVQDLPKTIQAANAFRTAFVSGVSPSDERNVGNTTLIEKAPGEGPIVICVGKKP